MYGNILSTVATNAQVLKHQAIKIYSLKKYKCIRSILYRNITVIGNNIRK